MRERRGAFRVLMGKPLGRPSCRWEDNINGSSGSWMGGMDWIDLAQDRDGWLDFVNAIMNLWVQ